MTANEKKPLFSKIKDRWSEAYSLKTSHATIEEGRVGSHVVDYEPSKLSTFRAFFAVSGTVLEDPVLFTEQAILTAIFFACAAPVYYSFHSKSENAGMSVNHWLDSQEAKMRAFSTIMTTLAAFLLSFYTSITVNRWWTIRTQGVGAIKAAAMELEMFVHQLVTEDEQVLSAIRRYARASLCLIFLWRRGTLGNMKEELTSRGILFEEECDKLAEWNHNLHESIWMWEAAIISMLHDEGKIKNPPFLCFLLGRVSQGRTGVQVIATHLSVKVPMQYVHLLGFLVKMHNLVIAVLMGILFGAAVRDAQVIICCQLFGRTLVMPLLFNAILLINAELSDPFDGGNADFPASKYDKAIENDAKAKISAANNLPAFIAKRRIEKA